MKTEPMNNWERSFLISGFGTEQFGFLTNRIPGYGIPDYSFSLSSQRPKNIINIASPDIPKRNMVMNFCTGTKSVMDTATMK